MSRLLTPPNKPSCLQISVFQQNPRWVINAGRQNAHDLRISQNTRCKRIRRSQQRDGHPLGRSVDLLESLNPVVCTQPSACCSEGVEMSSCGISVVFVRPQPCLCIASSLVPPNTCFLTRIWNRLKIRPIDRCVL